MAGADRFSLHRYSLGSEDNRIRVPQTFEVRLTVAAGASVPIKSSAFFGTSLLGQARGTVALPSSFLAETSLSVHADAKADICIKHTFAETLLSQSRGAKDIRIAAEFVDALEGNAYACTDIPQRQTFESELLTTAHGSKDIRSSAVFSETLTVLSGASIQDTDVVKVALSLPPGAELRIDSDTFSVTLNGENILYAQSGDWIRVARELLRLDIESASGGSLEGNLVYTERYL